MPDEPVLEYPTQGGSYIRNPDGTLTCVTPPTIIPESVPTEPPPEE